MDFPSDQSGTGGRDATPPSALAPLVLHDPNQSSLRESVVNPAIVPDLVRCL